MPAYTQTLSPSADEAKRADVRRLLELVGAGDLGKQVMTQMINQFRTAHPQVPQRFWTDFASEINADEILELSVPAYEKHLTHEEIKQLIAFYESPVGKKLIQVQPQIVQDSMIAGQKWGQDLGRKVMQRLIDEGLQPRPESPAPEKSPAPEN
jgi:hypothetical protein